MRSAAGKFMDYREIAQLTMEKRTQKQLNKALNCVLSVAVDVRDPELDRIYSSLFDYLQRVDGRVEELRHVINQKLEVPGDRPGS